MASRIFSGLPPSSGISKVELRNDLPGGKVTDGLSASKAAALAQTHGVHVITINALQKFNLGAARKKAADELERLLDLAAELHCPALVLCPNNDTADTRDAKAKVAETVDALKAFGPSFAKRGLLGYVEPLGFHESSLASLVVAAEAIRSSGQGCYRAVYDTFHHYLGPDTENDIGPHYVVSNTGLIHVSGVDADVPKEKYRDEHRVLPGPKDRDILQGTDQPSRQAGVHWGYFLRAVLSRRAATGQGRAGGSASSQHGLPGRIESQGR